MQQENEYMREAIKELKKLPPTQKTMCTGFILGICAANSRKEEKKA